MDYREENNYPKAFAATSVILAVMIALCYFIVFHTPPKLEDGTGGILVNYGTTDEGKGDDYMSTEEPSVAEKANHTKPEKITPAPPTEQKTVQNSSDKVVTQNTEDAPEVNTTAKKPITNITAQPVKAVAKPTVNQNALYKGKPNNGTGQGDGTTDKPGNQGKPNGSTLTNNYNGTGSGKGGTLELKQRSFITKPVVSNDGRSDGKIVVDIQVDKNGNVTSAASTAGTTISDYNLVRKCEEAAKNCKINASESAPDTQRGQIVFVFKVN